MLQSPALFAAAEHFRVGGRQCLRSHAVIGIGLMGAALLFVAWLFASFSLRQPLVVGVDVAFSGMRLLGAFLVLLWVQEAYVRDVERKTVLSVFAYPAERSSYVLGRFAAIMVLAAFALVVWGGGLWLLGTYGAWGYSASSAPQLGTALLLALAGMWLDLVTIGAFMLFVVSVSTTRLLPLFMGLGFAVAARGLGPVAEYLRFAADADADLRASVLPLLDTIRWILPDLSRLDWREAMLYGRWPDIPSLLQGTAAAVGYVTLLLTVAVAIYKRREFS